MSDKNKKLIDAIHDKASYIRGKNRLDCSAAHDISKTYNVSLAEIGQICEDHDIRIKNCQLGCF